LLTFAIFGTSLRPETTEGLVHASAHAGMICFPSKSTPAAAASSSNRWGAISTATAAFALVAGNFALENRQTLWFRVQSCCGLPAWAEPARVQRELDLYNRLLRRGPLAGGVADRGGDETRLTEELAPWQTLRGEELRLRVGDKPFPADLLTSRGKTAASHRLLGAVSRERRSAGVPWRNCTSHLL